MTEKPFQDFFYINTDAMAANEAGAEAIGMVIDLLVYVWYPSFRPIEFDPEALAKRLNAEVPARGYTAQMFKRRRKKIASFFVQLPDGKWAPSPRYFTFRDDDQRPRLVK